ncbi:LOW QUALITY PROTEIN: PP2C domain-containing protein/DUF868 domain-containing protein, partial [Cephalotus follicularis]
MPSMDISSSSLLVAEMDKKPTTTTTQLPSSTSSSSSLKRKRPPHIEIPHVLQEIQKDKLKFKDFNPQCDAVSFSGFGVGVFSVKGKKKFMEDTHKIVSCFQPNSNKCFFGVYDGHGGKKAAEFVAENLHTNIIEMSKHCEDNKGKLEAVKAGYLKTDQDFLKQGLGSGTCCVTALIEGQELVISNLGDCRAVLCRGGVAEALTRDHKAEREDERKRIENTGGYVEIHRGAWRVHGILSVSRSIGDAHLKNWVLAEPDTKIIFLTPEMEFIILASDGLWGEVSNQEAVDTVTRLLVGKKGKPTGDLFEDNDENYGCVNVSPSTKLRRVSLVKQQNQAPRNKETIDCWKDCEHDDYASETKSPPLKSQRISLVKRINTKSESTTSQENDGYKKKKKKEKAASVGLMAACKELVNLAVRRGSLDDITVMIIDVDHFRCYADLADNEPMQGGETATVIRSRQSVFMSVYQTKLAGQCRSITITWCKNLLLHGLSVSLQGPDGDNPHQCKIELKPWYFWRKHGSKHFIVDGCKVDVVWDLKAAKFSGETEPLSDYYVAIVCDEEVVLVLGDLKKDAYRRTGCRPSLIEPMLVSRKEHVFGKKKFSTRIKLQEKGTFHDISIVFNNSVSNSSNSFDGIDPALEIRVDGHLAVLVKHLQWKFRGNEFINVSKHKVEVYWDVHDWLFGPGPRHGLFIFKPTSSPSSMFQSSISPYSSPTSSLLTSTLLSTKEVNFAVGDDDIASEQSTFCLFLYAWKVE